MFPMFPPKKYKHQVGFRLKCPRYVCEKCMLDLSKVYFCLSPSYFWDVRLAVSLIRNNQGLVVVGKIIDYSREDHIIALAKQLYSRGSTVAGRNDYRL